MVHRTTAAPDQRSGHPGTESAAPEQSNLYKTKYGAWAGRPEGSEPDFSRCCEEVREQGRWPRYYQCSRPRGHGPDGAYCKQHDPDIVKARQAATDARDRAKWNARRYEFNGRRFFDALVQIAEGHNDARGLAQQIVASHRAGDST